jgi:hypothetical protein
MEWIASPEIWAALVTLTVLEVVLGIDNIIFISILASKLPPEQQGRARRLGLALAMIMRILLLFSLAWVIRLTEPLFTVLREEISGRDLILIAGGLFLLAKSTHEIHDRLEGEEGRASAKVAASFSGVLIQIMLLDVVFSLDSVITAVGNGQRPRGHDRGRRDCRRDHDGLGHDDLELRRATPHREDARTQLSAADRSVAAARGLRPAHSERLRLLRDGLLGLRGDDQPTSADQDRARRAA